MDFARNDLVRHLHGLRFLVPRVGLVSIADSKGEKKFLVEAISRFFAQKQKNCVKVRDNTLRVTCAKSLYTIRYIIMWDVVRRH